MSINALQSLQKISLFLNELGLKLLISLNQVIIFLILLKIKFSYICALKAMWKESLLFNQL